MSQMIVIKQKVCRLMLLTKSMTGEEVAHQIIMVFSTELGIPSHLLIAAMRDRASVNSVAMRTVSILYNQVMDIGQGFIQRGGKGGKSPLAKVSPPPS